MAYGSRDVFSPHTFAAHENYIDLYHVYDDLSRTPYIHGIGIECEDPDEYFMHASFVITPEAMRKHLHWKNRQRTQFISFYDDLAVAQTEMQRRIDHPFVPNVGMRNPDLVRIAHVRLHRGTKVWGLSRAEMLEMIGACAQELFKVSHRYECYQTVRPGPVEEASTQHSAHSFTLPQYFLHKSKRSRWHVGPMQDPGSIAATLLTLWNLHWLNIKSTFLNLIALNIPITIID
ncbi:hypothetical protein LTR37_003007 [Vermiconidia calcicola]|uniref:Uncharacterized protein n=1 Tax=Vermiconidia calcicola TaxID=1690605 RepID=A0ACC3NQM7_9PEZI|nr:hypothetical protein LTR37_003007 [Vermiconidia calcicola]